jgi:hypothetical protein
MAVKYQQGKISETQYTTACEQNWLALNMGASTTPNQPTVNHGSLLLQALGQTLTTVSQPPAQTVTQPYINQSFTNCNKFGNNMNCTTTTYGQ